METTRGLPDAESVRVDVQSDADVFFATLRREQARFLDAVGRARSLLGRESGQLAHVTAIQLRLTRQFFDAQTAIMRRRAEVDAEVTAIARAADELALATVGTAREQVAAGLVPRLMHPSAGHAAEMRAELGEPRSGRQEIAALTMSVVTTKEDAEALGLLLEDAFLPDDPDGEMAERQLTALLEEWWAAEKQEGTAVIDDAHARAMMRAHLAEIEAREVLAAAAEELETEPAEDHLPEISSAVPVASEPASAQDSLVPTPLAKALQSVDLADLHTLLDELTASLYPPTDAVARPTPTEPAPVETPLILLDATPTSLPVPANHSGQALQPFWDRGVTPVARRHRWWNARPVVIPAAAIGSVIALVAVWAG